LITYEGHIQRDLVTWPKDARIFMPGWENPPAPPYPEASYNHKWFYNSGKAARHAINILWHDPDPDISVVPTSPTFQPPIHFLEDFEYTNLSQLPSNTWTLAITGSGSTVAFSTSPTHRSSKSLRLTNDGNDVIVLERPFSPALSNAIVTFWYYDPGGNGGFFLGVENSTTGKLVMMGVRTPTFPNHYFYRTDGSSIGTATSHPRDVGWHKFDLVIRPQGTYGRIDCADLRNELGQAATNPALTTVNKIYVASTWAQVGTAYIDDIQIRPFKTGLSTLSEDNGSDTYMPVIIK
jgi:hypothetical protein